MHHCLGVNTKCLKSSTCSLLIGAGADPSTVDNQGVSLEDLARKPDVKEIIALALAQNAKTLVDDSLTFPP